MVFYDTRSTVTWRPLLQQFCLHSLKENINPLENISHHGVRAGDTAQLLGEGRGLTMEHIWPGVSCVMCEAGFRRQMVCPGCWMLDVDPGLTVKEGTRSKPGQTVGAAFQTFKTTAVR